jgi:hypothetical protein
MIIIIIYLHQRIFQIITDPHILVFNGVIVNVAEIGNRFDLKLLFFPSFLFQDKNEHNIIGNIILIK